MFYSLGFFFFYPIIAGMGAISVGLLLLPSMKKFYGIGFEESERNNLILNQNVHRNFVSLDLAGPFWCWNCTISLVNFDYALEEFIKSKVVLYLLLPYRQAR